MLLTFADVRMQRSFSRVRAQAEKMKVYDQIITASEIDLEPNFRDEFSSVLKARVRGFGYWCWKPQIILQTLIKMNEGDLLQYMDVGCHLNYGGRLRLIEYFNLVGESENGVIGFSFKPPEFPLLYDGRKLFNYPEFQWVKGDLIDYFDISGRADLLNTPTTQAGIIFFRKCDLAIKFLSDWIAVYRDDFSLIDDSPSRSPNPIGFIEHRHDQSIYSILCKTKNIATLSAYETYYPNPNGYEPDWKALEKFPIHVKRDKDRGLLWRILKIINKKIKYFYKT